jgi:hypothetical protein
MSTSINEPAVEPSPAVEVAPDGPFGRRLLSWWDSTTTSFSAFLSSAPFWRFDTTHFPPVAHALSPSIVFTSVSAVSFCLYESWLWTAIDIVFVVTTIICMRICGGIRDAENLLFDGSLSKIRSPLGFSEHCQMNFRLLPGCPASRWLIRMGANSSNDACY